MTRARVGLYARTVRNLRWEQLVYRPIRRIQRWFPVRLNSAGERATVGDLGAFKEVLTAWGPMDLELSKRRAVAVSQGEYRFLNHAEHIPEIDWRHRYVSHLWNYNLHYFDYALDLAWAFKHTGDERSRSRFVELSGDWIDGCPAGRGDGWEPYAISLRVVNWVYALAIFADAIEPEFRARIEASIAKQVDFLSRRLEFHVLGNHLQKNLKALVIAGLYFSDAVAAKWLGRAIPLLWRELAEQVLPDGGHFERSPMYHAIALADFLELIDLLRASGYSVPETVLSRVGEMSLAYGILTRPDGSLHLFNDAAQRLAPPDEWLTALAERVLGQGVPGGSHVFALGQTGYYGYACADHGEKLIIDCGPLGPRYQPGHGHCDLLSFEWIVNGKPVVVDSGVAGYEGDAFREYVRSTRAHNTVSVDGHEQAEVWGTFRVARHPSVKGAAHNVSGGCYQFEGAYSPYFDRGIVHRRKITRSSRGLSIYDMVEWPGTRRAISFLHLHPDFEVRQAENKFIAAAEDFKIEIEVVGAEKVSLVRGASDPMQGWYCPEFGMAVPAVALIAETEGRGGCEMSFLLRLFDNASQTTLGSG